MTARRLDTYRVRNSDGTEEPVCRDCQECQSIEAIPKNHYSRAILERGCLAMCQHVNGQLCELLGLEPCFILNLEGTEATRDEEPVATAG